MPTYQHQHRTDRQEKENSLGKRFLLEGEFGQGHFRDYHKALQI